MNNNEIELIVFGGSFDPPHAGHSECLRACRFKFPKSHILVVPSPSPAGILERHKTPELSFRERLKLCVLQFDDFVRHQDVSVSNFEENLPKPNFTLQTLEHLKRSRDLQSMGFLMGLDQFLSFHLWKGPREILKKSGLIVVNRSASKEGIDVSKSVKELLKKIDVNDVKESEGEFHFAIDGHRSFVVLLPQVCHAANSSAIRTMFAEERVISPGWMNKNVIDYIKRNRLYGARNVEETDDD